MIRKIIEESPNPWEQLLHLSETGLLKDVFPELSVLDCVLGNYKNPFLHTLQVLHNVVCSTQNGNDPVLRWAAVLHDIGKPATALEKDGKWSFDFHETAGSKMAPGILERYGVPADWIPRITRLVYLHLRPFKIIAQGVTDSAVRRVITEAAEDLWLLLDLAESDLTGRGRKDKLKILQETRSRYNNVLKFDYWESIRPVTNGTWLIERYPGITGPEITRIKDILKKAISEGCPNTVEALEPIIRSIYVP